MVFDSFTRQSVSFLLPFVYKIICWQMLFKIGVFKNFTNFRGKYLYWSLFLVKLQAWFAATLLKRDSYSSVLQHRCFPVKFAKFLKIPSFYRTLPVAASAFIMSTHALRIKVICRDSGTGIFLLIMRKF